jgi:ADP-ribosyl-[dinitrogen reductase] hydrolase
MKHRNDLMLLRIAQGDAYGMAREYVKRKDFPELYLQCLEFKQYLQHPTYHKLPPGTYTDDTQMSLAVTEALINAQRGVLLTAEVFVQRFFDAFKRDPRDGYSRAFQAILEEATSPDHLRQLIVPTSHANGAAMRSVPIGVIKDPKEVMRIAGMQAATTHASYGGINASIAVALMSHFALYDRREFSSIVEWGNHHCPAFEYFREPWSGPVQENSDDGKGLGVGLNTAWAVSTLLMHSTSLMDMMKRAIMWGGDTDSVCAIAWGIASCRALDEDIPTFLERDLEQHTSGQYGVTYLKQLGKQLMDAYV